jgi:hypothetical protein
MNTWMTPWLLLAVPSAGALLSALAWSKPRDFKTGLLLTTIASLLTVVGMAVTVGMLPSGMALPACCRWRRLPHCWASRFTKTTVRPG